MLLIKILSLLYISCSITEETTFTRHADNRILYGKETSMSLVWGTINETANCISDVMEGKWVLRMFAPHPYRMTSHPAPDVSVLL